MLYIKKKSEPSVLTQYKQTPLASFSSMPSEIKQIVKKALLEEQGHLCAYCMQRISIDNMKIEHYLPQSKYPQSALEYNNLLAVCGGGMGNKREKQFCDSHKQNTELTKVNPLDKSIIDMIQYERSGTIFSNDLNVQNDLDNILNLNCLENYLPTNRREVYLQTIENINRAHKNGDWTKAKIRSIISQISSFNSKGELQPYIGISVYFLYKHLLRAK